MVVVSRLDSIAPALAARFRQASADKRRQAALLACQYATTAVWLVTPEVGEALVVLQGLATATSSLRQRLEEMAVDFDDQYFRLDEQGDPANKDEALRLFSKARATSALAFALSGEDQLHEALYEAVAAVNDPEELTRLVDSILNC